MKINLPLLEQQIVDGQLVSKEKTVEFEIDTSVYSEERWEQHFPALAAKRGLFQYIEHIQSESVSDRVQVVAMLKAVFCFIESKDISSYKDFAKMFNLAAPEYVEKLINTLLSSFKLIIGSSAVKN